ncbi:hypothetical protein KAZ93_04600 [Patescibacteria group bacterium]|nr:hypothetical protein [Patescibacteria group bacterium]
MTTFPIKEFPRISTPHPLFVSLIGMTTRERDRPFLEEIEFLFHNPKWLIRYFTFYCRLDDILVDEGYTWL